MTTWQFIFSTQRSKDLRAKRLQRKNVISWLQLPFHTIYCLLRLNDLSKNSFWLQKQHLLSLQIYFCSPAKQKRQGKMGIKNVLIISHLLLCILRSQYIDLDIKVIGTLSPNQSPPSDLSGWPDIFLGSGTFKKTSPKYRLQKAGCNKQGHCY